MVDRHLRAPLHGYEGGQVVDEPIGRRDDLLNNPGLDPLEKSLLKNWSARDCTQIELDARTVPSMTRLRRLPLSA